MKNQKKSQTFGQRADNLGNIGVFGVFSADLSAPFFGTVSPLSMFSNNQPLSLQKTKPLYHKYLFGIWI